MKYPQIILFLLIALLGSGLPAAKALARGDIELQTIIEMEIETVTATGQKEFYRIPVDTAAPGSHLIYTIHYKNIGRQEVVNAIITTPVPANILYQEGSVQGAGASVTFSIDGGRTYHPPALLVIKDSRGREFPAQPKDYSHIRWTFKSLAPGARGSVSYRGVLR